MTKLKEILLVSFAALVLILITKPGQAKERIYPPGMITQTPVPLFCGYTVAIIPHTINVMEMKNLALGEVRLNADPNNERIGRLSFFYDLKTNSGAMYMSIESERDGESYTCLLGYGINWKFDWESMIDVVNEVINEDEARTQ